MTSEQQKLVIGILAVSLLAIIIYFISSCGCKNKKNKENYVKEYTGVAKSSTFLYRPYATSMEENPKDRCQFCKGYNNYSFEPFENTDFKLCPHNCREYGVALCNSQGKMM